MSAKKIISVYKSNIDWCTHTCNIITGCKGPTGDGQLCQTPEGGEYCYAEPFANRIYKKSLGEGNQFKPHFWRERLEGIASAKDGSRIFMNSMGDAFGNWVPIEWIVKMLIECAAKPECTFYFLTKNPKRYFENDIETFFRNNKNFWMGFTAETGLLYLQRRTYWQWANKELSKRSFVSIEPMFDGKHTLKMNSLYPGWVIVGAQTKPLRLPSPKWIATIRQQCKVLGIPIFMKTSLTELDLPGGLIQEIP